MEESSLAMSTFGLTWISISPIRAAPILLAGPTSQIPC